MPGEVVAGAWPPVRAAVCAGGGWLRAGALLASVAVCTAASALAPASAQAQAQAAAAATAAATMALRTPEPPPASARTRASVAMTTSTRIRAIASAAMTTPASPTVTRMAAALRPDRPRARGALYVHVAYGEADGGLPVPVRLAVLRLPSALGIDIPVLRSCQPTRLRALGTKGCPPQSLIGHGEALVEATLGSQLLGERVALSLFIGPLVNLQPTFEILAAGNTPFRERLVVAGKVIPDETPFGEDLAISLPAIPTLPLEPDAAVVSLSLIIGSPTAARSRQANAVVAPARCPAGALPLAIDSTFADGSSDTAATSLPCPR